MPSTAKVAIIFVISKLLGLSLGLHYRLNKIIMKKSIHYIALAALTAVAVASCADNSKLAKQIEGSWQGNPVSVPSTSAGIINMTDTWTFINDDTRATGGELVVTSMASVEWPLTAEGDSVAPQSAPYALTLAASVSFNASWDLDADDPDEEILVSIDPKTMSISIDPAAVALSTDGNPTTVDSIPPSVYAAVRSELTRAVQSRFYPINHLDNVKIQGSTLKFEVPSGQEKSDDVKMILTRKGGLGR